MAEMNTREASKAHWQSVAGGNYEGINAGSLQRIADATELMAKNYLSLQADVAKYKRWYEQEQGYNKGLRASNANLKGQITKLKKAAQAAKVVTVDASI